jgi:hypothetical protein
MSLSWFLEYRFVDLERKKIKVKSFLKQQRGAMVM